MYFIYNNIVDRRYLLQLDTRYYYLNEAAVCRPGRRHSFMLPPQQLLAPASACGLLLLQRTCFYFIQKKIIVIVVLLLLCHHLFYNMDNRTVGLIGGDETCRLLVETGHRLGVRVAILDKGKQERHRLL